MSKKIKTAETLPTTVRIRGETVEKLDKFGDKYGLWSRTLSVHNCIDVAIKLHAENPKKFFSLLNEG